MISYRQADLLDQYNEPYGKISILFTESLDSYADGKEKYSVNTNTGIDYSNCNAAFKEQIKRILGVCGFDLYSDHSWKMVFPHEQVSGRNHEQAYINKTNEFESWLKERGFKTMWLQDQLEITHE